MFSQESCFINQLQTLFENKVRFEKNLAPRLKSKAFKTKLSQGFWFENILLIEKQNFCFSKVKL
jgi:hypothetical protein